MPGLTALLYAARVRIPSHLQLVSWSDGALDVKASLFGMTEAWQAGLYAVAVGWYWVLMILNKRGTHHHLARHISQIIGIQEMLLLGSFQPACWVVIYICGQTPGRSQPGWLHIASQRGIAGI